MSVSPHSDREPEVKKMLTEGYGHKKISDVTGIPKTSIRRMVARIKKSVTAGEYAAEDDPVVFGVAPTVVGPRREFEVNVEHTPNGCVITGAIANLDDIWEFTGFDPDEWDVPYFKPNAWTGGIGEGRVVQHIQSKATLVPRKPLDPRKWKAELLADVRKASPKRKLQKKRKMPDPVALEIAIYDLHLGKLSHDSETGSEYNMDLARNAFEDTIDQIIYRAEMFPDVEQIVFPIGNDWGHIDNMGSSTTAGTPQDIAARLHEIIKVGKDMLIDAIEQLADIAPVHVISVPGNHDYAYTLFMAEIIESRFWNDDNVTVDNSARPRKFWSYGNTLLGFTHGKYEKRAELPIIMANEAEAWVPGNTQSREWHVGHLHKKDLDESYGVRVRQIASLSGIDAWHNLRGFTQMRAAESFIWSPKTGEVANFTFPLRT
jgi:hypothetical protein